MRYINGLTLLKGLLYISAGENAMKLMCLFPSSLSCMLLLLLKLLVFSVMQIPKHFYHLLCKYLGSVINLNQVYHIYKIIISLFKYLYLFRDYEVVHMRNNGGKRGHGFATA